VFRWVIKDFLIHSCHCTMERLRLWRYKKLANENVKDEKVIDDEADYNSCFQLRQNLKVRKCLNNFPLSTLLGLILLCNARVDNATATEWKEGTERLL
jgi:hypothetical protein